MPTDMNKLITRAKELEQAYLTKTSSNRLKAFFTTTGDIESQRFYHNIKFLYVYQLHSTDEDLTLEYKQLSQKRYSQIETYLSLKINEILMDPTFHTTELEAFFNARVLPLYKAKYRIYPSTTISYLPLKLRLKVYFWLYQNESDEETKCHLRNRLAVTLARLQHLELANLITVYNWIIAQTTCEYFAKETTVKTTFKAVIRHYERYQERNFETETNLLQPMAEIYVCFTKLFDEKTFKYDKHHSMCIDLLSTYYKEFEELKPIGDLAKNYLRTKDKKIMYQKLTESRLEVIKMAIHLPNQKSGYTLPPDIKLQLELYDKLIILTE